MPIEASEPIISLVRQQVVVERVREMILTGDLAGGERLMELTLSEQMGVSRTPTREALIILAEEGLVQYRPNRGYVVRDFTLDYIMNAYAVRETLEGLACRLAAERGIEQSLRGEFIAVLDEGDELLSSGGLQDAFKKPLREINDRFHRLIFQAANNPVLVQALNTANNIPYSSSRVSHWYDEGDPEGLFALRAFHTQHRAIFRAICGGEGYRAETLMRSHIGSASEQMRSHLGGTSQAESSAA
jgi:GntR family transcriptional regulator, vanillate catabolism transcriptional regulator